MSVSFDFTGPDLFTAGTIGPPGQRVFYLQARQDGTLVTLKCEKDQVRVLGDYLSRLLERLPPLATRPASDLALVEPVTAAWTVGSIGVAYDEGGDRIVLVIGELREDTGDEGEGESEREGAAGEEASKGASGRVHLTRAQTAAFVARARALVEAGRPSCQLCGQPMNPGGHRCPRTNGHRHD
jgi:uncharacterized repeat protein (TIGR03847 family)